MKVTIFWDGDTEVVLSLDDQTGKLHNAICLVGNGSIIRQTVCGIKVSGNMSSRRDGGLFVHLQREDDVTKFANLELFPFQSVTLEV